MFLVCMCAANKIADDLYVVFTFTFSHAEFQLSERYRMKINYFFRCSNVKGQILPFIVFSFFGLIIELRRKKNT